MMPRASILKRQKKVFFHVPAHPEPGRVSKFLICQPQDIVVSNQGVEYAEQFCCQLLKSKKSWPLCSWWAAQRRINPHCQRIEINFVSLIKSLLWLPEIGCTPILPINNFFAYKYSASLEEPWNALSTLHITPWTMYLINTLQTTKHIHKIFNSQLTPVSNALHTKYAGHPVSYKKWDMSIRLSIEASK